MLKLCKKCDKEFTPQKGLLNFCSLACRNSRKFSAKAKLKKSIKSRKAWEDGKMDMINFKKVNNSKHKIEKGKLTWINKYLEERESGVLHSWDTLRKYHFIIQNHTCEVCTTSKWNGQKIPLELHHINGDLSDNTDENLQVVCPNCHAQTHNFRGKNIRYSLTKFLDKDEVFDERIEDFTLSNLVKEYNEMERPPNGYVRKRHYFINKYKVSNGMMARLIFVHRRNPMLIDMIDNNKDLTLTMVYKIIKYEQEI